MTAIKVKDLLPKIKYKEFVGDANVVITGLNHDSRSLAPGDLFFCLKGSACDGHDYASQVVASGASVLCVERILPLDIPQIKVEDMNTGLAEIAAAYYDYPADKLELFGITGTNGKTTVSFLLERVLSDAGFNPAVIGTLYNKFNAKTEKNPHTTPQAPELHRFFRQVADQGGDSVSMEVSSHSLALGRVHGLKFRAGIFTNLTQDHLDFHAGMEEYFLAKQNLFSMIKPEGFAVINLDDPRGESLLSGLKVKGITYGVKNPQSMILAKDIILSPQGSRFTLVTPQGEFSVNLQINGMFNVSNVLAALATAWGQDLEISKAIKSLEGFSGVKGRFEKINEGQDFLVIVDYAHTPDALERVLKSAREFTSGKVIAVFGCGGNRDRKKRPIMGKIGAACADLVVITSDNPRKEDCQAIIGDILAGMEGKANYLVEADRKLGIEKAIRAARPGDSVIIAGKGHEDYQIFADRTIHFDDGETAREILRGLK